MTLRLSVAAALAALAAAQTVQPPQNLTAIAGDNAVTVNWNPSGDGRALSYTVTLEPAGMPNPGVAPASAYNDDFDGTSIDTTAWSFTSGICSTSWGTGCAGSPNPTYTVSGGAVRVSVPYRQTFAPNTVPSSSNSYGRNGVPFLERRTTGEVNTNIVFYTAVGDDAQASYTSDAYNGGIMVYDLDGSNMQRWQMSFYYKYASNANSINGVFVRYSYSSGFSSEIRLASSMSSIVELWLVRDNSNARFGFFYRRAGIDNFPVDSNYFIYDSWLTAAAWSPANGRVALFASNDGYATRTVPLYFFKTVNYGVWQNYTATVAAAVLRNNTIATNGICAVQRTLSITVPHPVTSATFRNVYNGESYTVAVAANGAVATSVTIRMAGAVSPTVQLPSVPGVGLFLDSLSVRPTGTSHVPRWNDVSGNGRHFVRGVRSQYGTPYRPFPGPTDRAPGIYFTQTFSDFTQENEQDQFLTLDAAFQNHETTWFVLYQPTMQYNAQGLFSKGAYGAPGTWEISSYYYSWPDSYLGMRIYGSGTQGITMAQKLASGVHPHSGSPTLLTYNYAGNGQSFTLHACEGINWGFASDRCSQPSPTNPTSTNSPWINQFVYGQYYDPMFPSLSTNTITWPSFTASSEVARVGDARAYGYGYTWNQNYYNGYIHSLMVYKGANAITTIRSDREAVQRYLLDRYYKLCPTLNPAGSTSSCSSRASTEGQTCSNTCNAPQMRMGGAVAGSAMTCNSGAWSARGIQCGFSCPIINSPSNVKSCSKYYHSDDFNSYAANSDLTDNFAYATSPNLPVRLMSQFFTVVAANGVPGQNYLQANMPARSDSCAVVDPATLILNNPTWADPSTPATEPLTHEVNVMLSSTNARAGLAFRVLQQGVGNSMYRVSIGHGTNGALLEKSIRAAAGTSVSAPLVSTFVPRLNTWYKLAVTVSKTSIVVYINGTLMFDTTDSDISMGHSGLYVENGLVFFDDWSVYGSCESNGNCFGYTGQRCLYQCMDGYTMLGNASQVCGSGTYAGELPRCVPTPPNIPPGSFVVSEDAGQGFVFGKVNATSQGAGREVILYEILSSSNVETIKDRFGNNLGQITGVFGVNLCSGEVYVAKSGIMNWYTGSRTFNLVIRAKIGNKQDVFADGTFTVTVLKALRPPQFDEEAGTNLRYFRSVAENSPTGTPILPPVSAVSLEGNPLVYDIIFGNAANVWRIDNTTGQLYVNRNVLNYEDPAFSTFQLMVRARDATKLDLSANVLVEVHAEDEEDPPKAENPQKFQIDESRSLNGYILGKVIGSDEDLMDFITFGWDGVTADTNKFHLNTTTGELTLKTTLRYDPETAPVNIVDRLQTREVFYLPCKVTDSRGPMSTPFQVVVYIIANVTTGPDPVLELAIQPAEGFSTKGGQQLIIGGQNFDSIVRLTNSTREIEVNFTTQGNDPSGYRVYRMRNCEIADPAAITCDTAPGFGENLAVSVRYGRTRKLMAAMTAVLVSYARPTIVSVTYALEPGKLPDDPNALTTAGGSSLLLRVREFGPVGTPLIVQYGVNFEYNATVVYDATYPDRVNDVIKFYTTEGVGANLPFRVTAGLRPSYDNPSVTISYAPPAISSIGPSVAGAFSVTSLATAGGQSVLIQGRNFGPLDVMPTITYTSTQTVPIDAVSRVVKFSFTPQCRKSDRTTAHTRIVCDTQPGAGKDHALVITVGNQTVTSVAPNLLSYTPPVAASASGPGNRLLVSDTQGGLTAFISGSSFGPVALGDGSEGSITYVPLSITYGPTGTEYIAQNCRVSRDDQLLCSTAPGTGKGHIWRVVVAGQSAPVLLANTSYAPPVITAFNRIDNDAFGEPLPINSFLTDGMETVEIQGKNFGPYIAAGKFTATYTLTLRDNKTDYGTFVGGDQNNQIVFSSSTCFMHVPHFTLRCLTSAGAGGDLSWTLIVDSQSSTQPVTAYNKPVIAQVRDLANSAITAASTDGGDTVVLRGSNFGPRVRCQQGGWTPTQRAGAGVCRGYIQQLRFGRNGNEYIVADYDVVDHETLHVRLAPGFGQNLYFTVTVAGQRSDLSAETFSYAFPRVLFVSPSEARTDATPSSPVTITVTGRDFSVLDPQAEIGILFGNPGDQTLITSPLRIITQYPDWSDKATLASYAPGSNHRITFSLPQGLMRDRAVRVAVYARGQPNGYRMVSDPIFDASLSANNVVFFSYTYPRIDTVVVAVPDSANTDFVRWILNNVPDVTNQMVSSLYVLTLTGSNFGPNASVTNDGVRRVLQYVALPTDPPTYAEGIFYIYSWTHDKIVAITKRSAATIRVTGQGRDFLGAPAITYSNDFPYDDLSPSVGSLVGNLGPFDTSGGAIITFTLKYMRSTQNTVIVTVGGRKCPIIDRNDVPVADNAVVTSIIRDVSYQTPGATDRDTVWTLRCVLPQGEGAAVPLVIQRDLDFSSDGVTVSYRPPVITYYSVWNATRRVWMNTSYLGSAPERSTLRVGTEPMLIRINGANFGLCPKVIMGNGEVVRLGGAACNAEAMPVNPPTHTMLEFYSVAGEGTGLASNPLYGYTLVVDVAGQTIGDSGQVLKFRYNAPVISSVTSRGRTAGGDFITIRGQNFGVNTPLINIGRTTGTHAPGFLPCSDVQFDRNDDPEVLVCTLAEGSGANLDVVVQVADQTATRRSGFSYYSPQVDTVIVEDEDPARTINMGNPGSRTIVRAPTKGGYNVTLIGDNFGALNNLTHCMFVSWRARNPGDQFSCNAAHDFIGEGEVPYFAVYEWTHTQITFMMPPGAGARDIIPFVRGQMPGFGSGVVLHYKMPAITAQLEPATGNTNGGEVITITGLDFGAAPAEMNNSDGTRRVLKFPEDLDEYRWTNVAPMQQMSVNFFKFCISNHRDAAGVRPRLLSRCMDGIAEHNHSVVRFRTPSYIGVNRTVSVTITDQEPSAADASLLVDLNFTSNVVLFSYSPPKLLTVSPSVVLMDGQRGSIVSFTGANVSTLTGWADSCAWTENERLVQYTVAGIDCPPIADSYSSCGNVGGFRPGPVERQNEMVFECAFASATVGHKNLSYSLVGQTNFNDVTEAGHVFAACYPGFFGYPGETCLACPVGAKCAGFDQRIRLTEQNRIDGGAHTYPRPIAKFYNLNDTMNSACPPAVRALFPDRDVCIVACEPPEACKADNYCNEAYKSVAPYFRCATCADGYYKRANECVRCPDSPWALIIGFVLLVAFGGAAAYILNKKKINLAFISIGVDYFQVLAIFAQSKVQWPPVLKELYHILSAFNLNIEIVAPECVVPNLAYKQKWSFIMALPVSIGVFFALVTTFSALYKSIIMGRKVKISNQTASLSSSLLLMMYILYIYLTRNVLDIFNCAPTEPPDGRQYLSAVFEECGVPGGSQMTLMPAAVVALVVYVLGYPAYVAQLLYKNREVVMEDQLLRAKGTGDDKLTNPRAYHFRKRFNRVYYQFKPDCFLWVEAILIRKFLLAVTFIMFNRNSSFQLAAALLIMFLAYSAHVRFNPYMGPGDVDEVIRSHTDSANAGIVIHAKLKDRLAAVESRGRKKVFRNVMNSEGKVDTAALLGVLRTWLFNYNTVEAIMIFSAVIVALMGIMYSAQNVNNSFYQDARDAVTGVTLLVVITSIVYFFAVVVTEISILASEESRRRAIAKQRAKRKTGDNAEMRKKDKAAVVAQLGDDGTMKMIGPVNTTNNPLFADASKGASTQASIQEAILTERRTPSVELWKMFQVSFISLQEEMDTLSRELSEAKLQQQKLEAARSMLANVGINVAIPDVVKSPGGQKKARNEFAPSVAGGDMSPAMRLQRTKSAKDFRGPASPGAGGLKMSALRAKSNANAGANADADS